MERGLDLGCLIAMRECKSRSKIFNFFSKRVFSMFQDSSIILNEKIFSEFQTNQSPGIAMGRQRQKLPLHVIREGRLSLFGSHGKGTGSRVSHCDARVQVEVKHFLSFFP